MKIGGCKLGDGKTRGWPWPKEGDGGAEVSKIGTKTQRVSTPPPPPSLSLSLRAHHVMVPGAWWGLSGVGGVGGQRPCDRSSGTRLDRRDERG